MLTPLLKQPKCRATTGGSGEASVLNAAMPQDEAERIEELAASRLLDTEPETAFDDVAELASVLCDTPMALVSLVDRDRQWFKARVGVDLKETPRQQSFCAHAILSPADIFVVPDASDDVRFHDNPLVTGQPKVRFYAGVPLKGPGGHALGTLCVMDSQPRTLTQMQRRQLKQLAGQLEVQLQLREMLWQKELLLQENQYYQRKLEQANRKLEEQSLTDALTGLRNRRDLDRRVREEIERAKRHQTPLAVAVIDIDNFKRFNDQYGHLAGDAILRRVSRLLQENSRSGDYCCRNGGDEFLVIMPDTDLRGARELMQRFCDLVSGYSWKTEPVTVSVGLAEFDDECNDRRKLIDAADKALYQSKRSGRNRVSTIG